MLTPSIFGENLFDDWFDDFPFFDDRDLRKVDKKLYGRRAGNLMKTDIQEMKDGYKMEVDLPGFKKDEITVELDDGYLTISAAKGLDQDEKEKESERYSGSCSRSFYVGEGVKQEDIKAKFEDGTLKLEIPKEEAKPAVEQKKYIAIEG